jgi:hypothetical protein
MSFPREGDLSSPQQQVPIFVLKEGTTESKGRKHSAITSQQQSSSQS